VAALAALGDQDHWAHTRRFIMAERDFLSGELARRGFIFPQSHANFLLVHVPDAPEVRQKLLRLGVLVRDGAAVGFPEHLRISVGTREANQRVLSVLG
jgi:histidinol-phosphate aminotransferase